MHWGQIFTIVSVNIALFAAMAGLMMHSLNKHDADIKSVIGRLDGHASRIDQLYQMFVDLLKERK